MKQKPQTIITEQLDDLLLDGLPDLVNPGSLAEQLRMPPGYTKKGCSIIVGRWLRSIGAVRFKPYTAIGDTRVIWSLRDHDRYTQMGPSARLAMLDGQYQSRLTAKRDRQRKAVIVAQERLAETEAEIARLKTTLKETR